MEIPKNYAFRSGAYKGALLSLKNDLKILELLDYNETKHKAFVELVESRMNTVEQICLERETEA